MSLESARKSQLRREAVVSRPARRMLRDWVRSSVGSRVSRVRAERKMYLEVVVGGLPSVSVLGLGTFARARRTKWSTNS